MNFTIFQNEAEHNFYNLTFWFKNNDVISVTVTFKFKIKCNLVVLNWNYAEGLHPGICSVGL